MTTRTDRQDLVSGRTLARIGLGLLLLGIVFLYRWGVQNGYIIPAARVGVGVALSSGMLAVGWVTRTRQATFGALLQGGGVAGLFVSAFAAHAVYGLTSHFAVFTQLVFVSALAIGLAVHQRIETLAVVGVLGALAAPQIVGGTIAQYPGDAGYVAVVVLAVGVLLYRYDWNVLFGVAAFATGITLFTELSGVLGEWDFTGPEAVLVYLAVLGALWGAPLARLIGRKPQNATVAMLAAITIPISAYFGAWAAWDDPAPMASGLVAAALALAMASVYVGMRRREPFIASLHLLPASVLSLAAIGLLFDGPTLMFAIAAQATGFVLIGRRIRIEAMELIGWTIYVLVATLVMVMVVLEPSAGVAALNGESLARLGVIALAAVVATSVARAGGEGETILVRFMFGFAHVGFMAWGLSELSRTEVGQPAVSVLWGAYALIIIGAAWSSSRLIRNVGVGTLLVTVTKVFLVDLDNASGGAKILLLMGFGLVLLALGYLMPSETSAAPPPTPDSDPDRSMDSVSADHPDLRGEDTSLDDSSSDPYAHV